MIDWLMSVVVVLAMIGFILMVGNLAFWVQRYVLQAAPRGRR